MARLGVALSTGLAVKTADYPMLGRMQEEPVMCYCGGVWVRHDPKRYEVIMVGVGEVDAQRNRERNRVRKVGMPDWVYE